MSASVMAAPLATRSSLEMMLDAIRRRDESPVDAPPALPARPTSRARLPSSRRSLPRGFKTVEESEKENRPPRDDKGCQFNNMIAGSKRMGKEDRMEESSHDGKDNALVDSSNQTLQGIVSVQKHFRGLQARLHYQELKGAVIILQSFVRGERLRCQYNILIKRSGAAIFIQKHVRRWIAEKTFHKHRKNAILLQSVIHGWLARKNFSAMKSRKLIKHIQVDVKKGEQSNFQKMKDSNMVHHQLHHSDEAELQMKILQAETALRQKEEENVILRKQLQQYEARWSEYEVEMKSMEEMWQKQMTSLQKSLTAAKRSLAADVKSPPGKLNATPIGPFFESEDYLSSQTRTPGETPSEPPLAFNARTSDGVVTAVSLLMKEFEKQKNVFEDDAGFLIEVKSRQPASAIKPDEELGKLKARFAAWKKDFKVRLRETSITLKKLVGREPKKIGTKWWSRKSVTKA